MAFCDFVVKYDPEKDSELDIAKRILYSIIIKPLKAKKPRVLFIGGDSGEGKSYTALRLQELLMEIQGLSLRKHIEDINVFTPLEYTEKLDRLLEDKELKKVNLICMHEAREVVKAKLWYSFINQSIGDINAMHRSIKRMCILIISQFIRDISNDIRYTLNFYCIVRRPIHRRARLYINVLWKDDRDLEKPKLRRRKLSGYLVYPDGNYKRYVPQYFEMNKASKDLCELFDQKDTEAKRGIIREKINKLIKEMKIDSEQKTAKVGLMVDYYADNPENLTLIGKQRKGVWRTFPKVRDMHELTKKENKDFEEQLNKKLKERGIIKDEKQN